MKVLITGGNGFLGRGIIRRAEREDWDWEITTMSRDESKMVRVAAAHPQIRTVKGDVSDDVDSLSRFFRGFDLIIHAAANKLVDIGERTAFEVVRNNIDGSRNVALAAMTAGVRKVIGISSDKAVQPVNVYGMSKAVMERIFQEANGFSATEFVCARYGNVVGSTISIVLYFEQQLRELGYVKATNLEMTRFYMGVDEAIDAILYALNEAQDGAVVIPKMQAMSVADVVRLVLNLEPTDDVSRDLRVRVVGARPGEKLHESLLHEQESVRVPECFGSARYYELRPAIEPASRKESFTITSDQPPLGWMTYEHMRDLIEDAKTV